MAHELMSMPTFGWSMCIALGASIVAVLVVLYVLWLMAHEIFWRVRRWYRARRAMRARDWRSAL